MLRFPSPIYFLQLQPLWGLAAESDFTCVISSVDTAEICSGNMSSQLPAFESETLATSFSKRHSNCITWRRLQVKLTLVVVDALLHNRTSGCNKTLERKAQGKSNGQLSSNRDVNCRRLHRAGSEIHTGILHVSQQQGTERKGITSTQPAVSRRV